MNSPQIDINIDINIDLVIREGWLKKQSRHLGFWKKRWVILKSNDILYTYKTNNLYDPSNRPTEIIRLNQMEFCIPYNEPINTFAIHSATSTFTFEAESQNEQLEWCSILAKRITELKKIAVTKYINEQKQDLENEKHDQGLIKLQSLPLSTSTSQPLIDGLEMESKHVQTQGCSMELSTSSIDSKQRIVPDIMTRKGITARTVYSYKSLQDFIQNNIKSLINNNTFSDVIFEVKDDKFYGIRALFAIQSHSLHKLLYNDKYPKTLKLEDIECDTFEFLYHIFYGIDKEMILNSIENLFLFAKKYQIEPLRKHYLFHEDDVDDSKDKDNVNKVSMYSIPNLDHYVYNNMKSIVNHHDLADVIFVVKDKENNQKCVYGIRALFAVHSKVFEQILYHKPWEDPLKDHQVPVIMNEPEKQRHSNDDALPPTPTNCNKRRKRRQSSTINTKPPPVPSRDGSKSHTLSPICAGIYPLTQDVLIKPLKEYQRRIRLDISYESLLFLRDFFYGFNPSITIKNVVDILHCADKFELKLLKRICIEYIEQFDFKDLMHLNDLILIIKQLTLHPIVGRICDKNNIYLSKQQCDEILQRIGNNNENDNIAFTRKSVEQLCFKTNLFKYVQPEIIWQTCIEWALNDDTDHAQSDKEEKKLEPIDMNDKWTVNVTHYEVLQNAINRMRFL